MNLSFPTVQILITIGLIALAAFVSRSRGGKQTGTMVFGLIFIAVPALFGAAAAGWPGYFWGAVGTIVLLRLIG